MRSIEKKHSLLLALLCTVFGWLAACQSNSTNDEKPTEQQSSIPKTIDYTGVWETNCLVVNDQQSRKVLLELNGGRYRWEISNFNGQDCSAIENRIYFQSEIGIYKINDPVTVPSGVTAHDVRLVVESRQRDGEDVDVSDDQGYSDYLYRNGDTLIRAKSNPFGVAAVQLSKELDYSIVYYLQ